MIRQRLPITKKFMGLFIITILSTTSSFAMTIATQYTVSGLIEEVSKDFKFIVVNRIKVFITQDTKITDENGRYLTRESLKIKAPVSLEVVQKPEGPFAQKLVVKIAR